MSLISHTLSKISGVYHLIFVFCYLYSKEMFKWQWLLFSIIHISRCVSRGLKLFQSKKFIVIDMISELSSTLTHITIIWMNACMDWNLRTELNSPFQEHSKVQEKRHLT